MADSTRNTNITSIFDRKYRYLNKNSEVLQHYKVYRIRFHVKLHIGYIGSKTLLHKHIFVNEFFYDGFEMPLNILETILNYFS